MRTPRDAIYDELLVLRWRRGEAAAMDELLRRWDRRLLYYVRRLVDDEQDAWDVLQQTWFQVVRRLSGMREPKRLAAWLYTIARNAALAHRRSAWAAERHIDGEAEVQDLADTADPDVGCDDAELVHEALAVLAPAHREALTLLFLRDLSIEEIAEVLGVSPGTVKSRVFYAKRHMREILARKAVGRG